MPSDANSEAKQVKSQRRRAGGATLKFLGRHWAAAIVVALLLPSAWAGYRMWTLGGDKAFALASRLATYLVLIVAVLVVRFVGVQLVRLALERGRERLKSEALREAAEKGRDRAGDLLDEGRDRAGELYDRGRERAEIVIDRGVAEAKELLGGITGRPASVIRRTSDPGARAAETLGEERCPHCGRSTRPGARFCDGCGALFLDRCPACGRDLRPGASFCDGCGAKLGSGSG